MSVLSVAVRRLPAADPDLPLPDYATDQAAGMDVHANLPEAARAAGVDVPPGKRALIPTGLALALPVGYEAQMRPRSGLALRDGLTLLNSPGTIDADYRGEVGVIVVNHGTDTVRVTHGMRIAQMVVAPVTRVEWAEADGLDETARGAGGFGSTGTGRGPSAGAP